MGEEYLDKLTKLVGSKVQFTNGDRYRLIHPDNTMESLVRLISGDLSHVGDGLINGIDIRCNNHTILHSVLVDDTLISFYDSDGKWKANTISDAEFDITISNFKIELKEERDQLSNRIDKLEKFMHSEKYDDLSTQQWELLGDQHTTMIQYLKILDNLIKVSY